MKLLQDDLKQVRPLIQHRGPSALQGCMPHSPCLSHSLSVSYFSSNFFRSQEKQDKVVLQAQIQSLREDNQRLQEESQSASAKLKKFTEWVFNTIDMN